MLTLLMSRTGLAIGGIGLAVILGYSWHRSIVRAEQQKVEAETRSSVVKELEAQHAIETQRFMEMVEDLQRQNAEIAKTRLGSVRVVEATTKQAEVQREEAPKLDVNSRRADIRARIARPAGFPDTGATPVQ